MILKSLIEIIAINFDSIVQLKIRLCVLLDTRVCGKSPSGSSAQQPIHRTSRINPQKALSLFTDRRQSYTSNSKSKPFLCKKPRFIYGPDTLLETRLFFFYLVDNREENREIDGEFDRDINFLLDEIDGLEAAGLFPRFNFNPFGRHSPFWTVLPPTPPPTPPSSPPHNHPDDFSDDEWAPSYSPTPSSEEDEEPDEQDREENREPFPENPPDEPEEALPLERADPSSEQPPEPTN